MAYPLTHNPVDGCQIRGLRDVETTNELAPNRPNLPVLLEEQEKMCMALLEAAYSIGCNVAGSQPSSTCEKQPSPQSVLEIVQRNNQTLGDALRELRRTSGALGLGTLA